MEFTREQRRAIGARGTNILLSAAAGSGKTTVLVERVLALIGEGADIDRMLIVTFTRAASADMRAKLAKELGRRAAEGDARCRSQQLLLERASISTLHAFCADFLRAHFESAGIDPAFRVLDDTETSRLLDEALDAALEEAYAALEAQEGDLAATPEAGGRTVEGETDANPDANDDEAAAADGSDARTETAGIRATERAGAAREEGPAADGDLSALDYGRGPKGVRAMVESLVHFLDERPDPEAWLESACTPDEKLRAAWLDELRLAARQAVQQALLLTGQALSHPGCSAGYATALLSDEAELARIADIGDFAEMQQALISFKQARPRDKRGEGPDEEVKKLRAEVKRTLEGIVMQKLELRVMLQDVDALVPEFIALKKLALRARELFAERKAELAGLSYADLEHDSLRALEDQAVAEELRQQYDYIFVDEYQDTSDVQEALITRIARGDNLFMVGDVKQSIYRFRQAEPRLFLQRYERYGRGEGGTLLPLTMNFRSRPAILDFVNRVFEHAMRGGDSEIVYDELARLRPGDPALGGGAVEIHLLEVPDAELDEELHERKACEREALFIARRIRELRAEDPGLHYRDIAILSRSKRGVLGRMAEVLLQEGIPAFVDGSETFYDAVEVLLALSLLKLTANRRNDVELIGALRSPVVGLRATQLADIRASAPGVPFVDAALERAGGKDETARQLRDFFALLERWRLMSLWADLGALTRAILEESGLYDCMGALPGGRQRQANLDQLVDIAARFDRDISGSLTRFLNQTEKLRTRGDGDAAHLLGENDDVVRLMTAHKSKGLEFPVVFGAMLQRKYRGRGSAGPLSAHRDLGLGCLCCDPALQTRRRTLPQLAIAEREAREDRAEELRVLYVLLTRARDRLELVGDVNDADRAWLRWRALREVPEAAGSHLDVIMSALEEDGSGLCRIHRQNNYSGAAEAAPAGKEEPQRAGADPQLVQALLWRYPHPEAARKPMKLSVTGLLRELQAPDAPEKLIERPAFLCEEKGGMSAADRGTAWHRAMELLDFAALRELHGRALQEAIAQQLDGFVEAGRLRPEQREVVELPSTARFLEGELGQRLLRAPLVRREWSFNARMPISEALDPEEVGSFAGQEILVQGTIDCCFQEEGRWVLLDYKTDRDTEPEALLPRYGNQLRLYADALKRITGMPAKEIYLCLLRSGEVLPVAAKAERA